MNVQVLPGDSPAAIAARLTGDPRRAVELVLVNAHKRRVAVPGGMTFQSLRPGEMLLVPWSWRVSALAGLPKGVVGLGLQLSTTDTGASLLATANGELSTAQGLLATLTAGNGSSAGEVVTAYNTAIADFVNAAQQASAAASAAQNAIVAASTQGQSDPAAVAAQNDYNGIQANIAAISNDQSAVSAITDPVTNDPGAAGANDAQSQAQSAVNRAADAVNQATNWSQGGNPSPGNQTIPTTVVNDAQAVAAAIAADPNYCTTVGQNGSAVNVAVHNFKIDWNAAGLSPTVPVGTGKFESITATAVSTALGIAGPAGCGGAPPAPPPAPSPSPSPTPAPTTASSSSMTPWLIAAGVVAAAGIGYAVYRNHEPTRKAVHGAAHKVSGHARAGYHAVRRRVAGGTHRRALAR